MQQWGLDDTPDGLARFAHIAVEALAPVVAAVKPQSAFFERHGSRGIAVLEEVVAQARERGALVVLDVKRGDIGSTAQAYADAYLAADSPLAVDAITASPYLGFGSLAPMIHTALAQNAGVFVLALTSNPEGAQVQRALTASGGTVAGRILEEVARCNAGADGLGSIGAVVGATIGETTERLDIGGPLLVPGIGAQGGTAADVRRVFGRSLTNVLPTSAREILAAGPDRARLRAAAERTMLTFSAGGNA
jgi:orotidine-5'-phosphate decarboxylase